MSSLELFQKNFRPYVGAVSSSLPNISNAASKTKKNTHIIRVSRCFQVSSRCLPVSCQVSIVGDKNIVILPRIFYCELPVNFCMFVLLKFFQKSVKNVLNTKKCSISAYYIKRLNLMPQIKSFNATEIIPSNATG